MEFNLWNALVAKWAQILTVMLQNRVESFLKWKWDTKTEIGIKVIGCAHTFDYLNRPDWEIQLSLIY